MGRFCSKCGNELSDDVKCSKCGAVSISSLANGMFDKLKGIDYKGKFEELKDTFMHSGEGKSDFLLDGEEIIMKGAANKRQLGGFAAKGGELILTNRRLIFKAHSFNVGSSFDEIPLSDVELTNNTLNLLMPTPNMIKVVMKDGTNHGFVVVGKQKDEWKKIIAETALAYGRNN